MLRTKLIPVTIAILSVFVAIFLMAVKPSSDSGKNSLSQTIFNNVDIDASIALDETIESEIFNVNGFSSLRLICSDNIIPVALVEIWFGPINTSDPSSMKRITRAFSAIQETPVFGPNAMVKLVRGNIGNITISCTIYAI